MQNMLMEYVTGSNILSIGRRKVRGEKRGVIFPSGIAPRILRHKLRPFLENGITFPYFDFKSDAFVPSPPLPLCNRPWLKHVQTTADANAWSRVTARVLA